MRILIVDDEPLVRKGLVTMLEKLGITAVEEANNGEAAKQMIESFRPDLVLADIVMPKTDGIELLKWMMLNYPDTRSVVLSSHQDFHYVKQAFIFGASDYILKYDINEEILHDTIMGALNKNKDTGAARESKTEELLFAGRGGEKYAKTGMAVLCICRGRSEEILEKLRSISGIFSFTAKGDMIYAVVSGDNAEGVAEELACGGYFCGISESGMPAEAPALRQHAEIAAAMRFFTGKRKVYRYSPVSHELPKNIVAIKKEITAQIFGAGMARLLERLDALYECVSRETGVSVIAVKIMYTSIAEMLAMKYPEAFIKDGINLDSVNKGIIDAEFLSDIKDIIDTCMKNILGDFLQVIDTSSCSEITNNAIEYINRHYSNGFLGLDTVAEEFGYTASYLSRMFKKDTGVNIVDYINETRILAARKMLTEGDRKVYEVAEEVGYNNYNHFSKTFKRIAGITPSQFLEDAKK